MGSDNKQYHLEEEEEEEDDDDEIVVQKVIQARLQHRQQQQQQQPKKGVLRSNNNRRGKDPPIPLPVQDDTIDESSSDPDDVTVIFPDNHHSKHQNFRGYMGSTGSSSSSTGSTQNQFPLLRKMTNSGIRRNYYHGGSSRSGYSPIVIPSTPDPWSDPAVYCFAATILVVVSAVVVHLIAIGNISTTHHHHHNRHNKSKSTSSNNDQRQKVVLRKKYSLIKKEDGYNEDAKDDECDDMMLPNDSTTSSSTRHNNNNGGGGGGGGGSSCMNVTTTCTTSGTGMSDSERTGCCTAAVLVLDDVTGVSHPFQNHHHHHNSPSYHPKPTINNIHNLSTNITGTNRLSQQQQQQSNLHRQRKNSATSSIPVNNGITVGTATMSLVTLPPPPPPILLQPQTATSNVGNNNNRTTGSRYHHPSGTSTSATPSLITKSPSIHQRTLATAIPHQQHPIMGYCPPSPIPPRGTATATKERGVIGTSNASQHILHSNNYDTQPQRPGTSVLHARPLSSSSKLSFESLLTDVGDNISDGIDSVLQSTTPLNNVNQNLDLESHEFTNTKGSTLPKPSLLRTSTAPDAVVVTTTPKISSHIKKFHHPISDGSSTIEQTPRMGNGRQLHIRQSSHLQQHHPIPVPEESPLRDGDCTLRRHPQHLQQQYDAPRCDSHNVPMMPPPPFVGSGNSRIDLSFAQSPKIREEEERFLLFKSTTNNVTISAMEQNQIGKTSKRSPRQQSQQRQNQDAIIIPFVPNLSLQNNQLPQERQQPQNHQLELPPQSVNLDHLLHYDRSVESGNMSSWAEEIISKESEQIQNRIFPGGITSDNNIRDSVLEASQRGDRYSNESASDNTRNSIPSNDPRKGIHHKRPDLTDDTDAAASLQGSIDFSEIQLIEVIGGGGFGQVWRASWRLTPVAVKVLTGSAQSKHVPRPVLEEFAAEINLLKGMRHPNICLYMGACLQPPNRAIITELAANGSLWDALRLPLTPPYLPCDGQNRSGWPECLYEPDERYGAPPTFVSQQPRISNPPKGTWHWVLVKRVAVGAARGMSYLHGGIIPVLHRDLKSANILLDESYAAKVCDFGLSRLKAQERSMTGNCGTVQWMAPEVLANQSYNEKADVYSYGVILWELLTRHCPYDTLSPIQCALAVLQRDQRPPIPKWCPPSFYALIQACWKKDPNERPSFPEILALLEGMP